MEWIEQAVCKSVDPELFMPEGSPSTIVTKQRQAQAICHTCPVQTECLDYALRLARQSAIYGVWGGLTAAEINKRARRLRVVA